MGYESDTLHSVRWISICSYPIIFKAIVISGSLYLPSHVLVQPRHEATTHHNPIRHCAQLIDGPTVNVRRNVGLSLMNVIIGGI